MSVLQSVSIYANANFLAKRIPSGLFCRRYRWMPHFVCAPAPNCDRTTDYQIQKELILGRTLFRLSIVRFVIFLLILPDPERHFRKKIKEIGIASAAYFVSKLMIGTPNVV
jgi:hypothetical protein